MDTGILTPRAKLSIRKNTGLFEFHTHQLPPHRWREENHAPPIVTRPADASAWPAKNNGPSSGELMPSGLGYVRPVKFRRGLWPFRFNYLRAAPRKSLVRAMSATEKSIQSAYVGSKSMELPMSYFVRI
jgi:hypothetical protein